MPKKMAAAATALAQPLTAAGWEQRLARLKPEQRTKHEAQLKEQAKQSATGGNWINVRQGEMRFQGQPIPDNNLDLIVLDVAFENDYYDKDFNADDTAPPVCFAIAYEKDALRPDPKSPKPQAEVCARCPKNEFGSANKGSGKACQNRKRLVVISASDLAPKVLSETDTAMMKTPVTSMKNWDKYASTLTGLRCPYQWAVTNVRAQKHEKYQQELIFNFQGVVPEPAQEVLDHRRDQVRENGATLQGYEPRAERAASTGKKKRKFDARR